MAVMPKFTGLLALCLCATAAIASPLPADNGVGTFSVNSPLGSQHIPRANSLPAAGNLGSDTLNAASVLGGRRVVDVEPVVDHSLNTDDKHSRRAKDDTVLNANAIDRVTSTYHNFEDHKRAPKHDQVVGVGGPFNLGTVTYHHYSDNKRDMGPPPPPPPPAYMIPNPGLKADLANIHLRQAGPPPPPPTYNVPNPNLGLDLIHVGIRQNPPPQEMSIPVTKGDVDVVKANT